MLDVRIFIATIATISATICNADPLVVTIASNENYVAPAPLIELDKEQMRCLAKNIYFEARNQSFYGKIAVAHATINRVESEDFPDSVCDVVKQGPLDGGEISRHRCQFSWYCDGKKDIVPVNDTHPEQVSWEDAKFAADLVANGWTDDETNGSTYYHTNYVDPGWNKEFELTAIVDDHLFYRHK